ncbi:MAG: hypothetical protein IK017_10365 [Paludibacteraceae bacterium]|nr:hypothetical protein [Paludibacteraceae bacterium]
MAKQADDSFSHIGKNKKSRIQNAQRQIEHLESIKELEADIKRMKEDF